MFYITFAEKQHHTHMELRKIGIYQAKISELAALDLFVLLLDPIQCKQKAHPSQTFFYQCYKP